MRTDRRLAPFLFQAANGNSTATIHRESGYCDGAVRLVESLKAIAFVGLVVAAAGSCSNDAPYLPRGANASPIEGTWRVVAYVDGSHPDDIRLPFGKSPRGYIVYDNTGHMFFQIATAESQDDVHRGRWSTADSASLNSLLNSATAYFGTYVVDRSHNMIIHKIEGEVPPNTGVIEQATPFKLRHDTLQLGKDSVPHWTLVRVRARPRVL